MVFRVVEAHDESHVSPIEMINPVAAKQSQSNNAQSDCESAYAMYDNCCTAIGNPSAEKQMKLICFGNPTFMATVM